MRARVRGIYSTALTRLLLDEGFEIVQPSAAIKERFKLEENSESPDLDVYERRDRQGVQALGRNESINTLVSILKSRLDDAVVRRWSVTADGIYKGLIREVNSTTHSVFVDLGPTVGRIQRDASSPEQRDVVVQVERRWLGRREPLLTEEVKIPGRYAILIPKREIKVSLKIRDMDTRLRLRKLGEELAGSDWGILWRTAASEQSLDVLKSEIDNLARVREGVTQKAELVEAPAVLWEGSHFVDAEFPGLSKQRLDEVRRCVAPTIVGHHFFKACGGKVSTALEMAERLLEKGYSEGDVKDLFEQTVELEYPTVGSLIDVEHVKLDGKVFHLGKALVEDFHYGESAIRFRRNFWREGVYDGLGTRKEAGDYAVTEAEIGEWHFTTRYFSKDGRSKGTYINLNTPIELYPQSIRYVDLEVDVCVRPDGDIKKLDEEELEKALNEGLVTEKLFKIVKEKTERLVKDAAQTERCEQSSKEYKSM